MGFIILLAAVMALFGVLGYLRGRKSMLVTTAVIWFGLIVVSRLGEVIAATVNGLNYAVRFVLAGGLAALGGDGDRGGALDRVFQSLEQVQPLIEPDGTGPGMIIIFLGLVLLGFLLGMLKALRSKPGLWSLLLGLVNGYVLTAYILRAVLPQGGFELPLPAGLFGPSITPAAAPSPAGPSIAGGIAARVTATLQALVDGGQIALLIAILIAVFVLLATRLGNRGAKKG